MLHMIIMELLLLKVQLWLNKLSRKKYKNVAFFSVWNSNFTDPNLIGEYIEEAYARLNKEFPDIFKREKKR